MAGLLCKKPACTSVWPRITEWRQPQRLPAGWGLMGLPRGACDYPGLPGQAQADGWSLTSEAPGQLGGWLTARAAWLAGCLMAMGLVFAWSPNSN